MAFVVTKPKRDVTIAAPVTAPTVTPVVTRPGGRPRVYATNADRQRAYRERKKAKV